MTLSWLNPYLLANDIRRFVFKMIRSYPRTNVIHAKLTSVPYNPCAIGAETSERQWQKLFFVKPFPHTRKKRIETTPIGKMTQQECKDFDIIAVLLVVVFRALFTEHHKALGSSIYPDPKYPDPRNLLRHTYRGWLRNSTKKFMRFQHLAP